MERPFYDTCSDLLVDFLDFNMRALEFDSWLEL